MTRRSLSREIQVLDQRLNIRQQQFHLTHEQAKVALKKINPYLLMATGLVAGAAISAMGWRKAYTAIDVGLSAYSMLISLPSRLIAMGDV